MSHSATPVDLQSSPRTQVQSTQLAVTFWGVRGYLPTPGLATAQYGGNTACTEICVSGQRLIFDGGTGLKALGDALMTPPYPRRKADQLASSDQDTQDEIAAHLFFTHARWDRIQGFPFFSPAFSAQSQFDIYGASAANGASIKQCLSTQMLQPNCPISFHDLKAQLQFHNLMGGQTLTLGSVQVATLVISPYTGAMGYRIRHQGLTVVYATEVNYATLTPALAQWSRGADLLICNSGALPKVSEAKPNLPVWQAAAELAATAQIKQTVLTGFSPEQTDPQLNDIARQLKTTTPQIRLAQEGLQICL